MKGLIEIPLAGKKTHVQFGMYSIKLLTEKRGITLNDLGELFVGVDTDAVKSFDLMVDLLWAGISNYNLINGDSTQVNYFKLYNDFGSVDKSEYEKIFKGFLETQISGQALSASTDELDAEPKDKKKV